MKYRLGADKHQYILYKNVGVNKEGETIWKPISYSANLKYIKKWLADAEIREAIMDDVLSVREITENIEKYLEEMDG